MTTLTRVSKYAPASNSTRFSNTTDPRRRIGAKRRLRTISPARPLRQQALTLKIAVRLYRRTEKLRLGRVFYAPCNILMDKGVVVQPDIFFVSDARCGIIGETMLYGAPDLAIEILSGPDRSLEYLSRKRLYSRFGVPELWTVDPKRRIAETFLWSELGYISTGVYGGTGKIRSVFSPELRLSLSGIF